MILTTLTAAALAVYTAKTTLGLSKNNDVVNAVSKFRASVSKAASEARQSISEARKSARTETQTTEEQSDTLIAKVISSATEQERETLTAIFNKYSL